MELRTLENTSMEDLLPVFNKSFENYFVPFNLSLEQLQFKVKADNIQPDLSVGVFDNEKLVGFIIHGLNTKEQCIYNGGTGVLPPYRGRRMTKKMYDYILPILREKGIKHSKLEVIKENVVAKKIYESIGFEEYRLLSCMRTEKEIVYTDTYKIHRYTSDEIISDLIVSDMIPAWQSSIQSIDSQKEKLVQYVVKENNTVAGNLILNLSNRILRLNVSKVHRRRGIGKALLGHASKRNPNLSVLNLDASNNVVIDFFKSQGFDVYLNQYEMRMDMN
ncbi:GNAT family N-acetyltransferase [Croceitalea marina]|uniref:GNAT family N-acetyltransferase n=1 Tax=Croceitalea marina TaxID=1775166 RepID=A0ABW5MSJ7_9FLAO